MCIHKKKKNCDLVYNLVFHVIYLISICSLIDWFKRELFQWDFRGIPFPVWRHECTLKAILL